MSLSVRLAANLLQPLEWEVGELWDRNHIGFFPTSRHSAFSDWCVEDGARWTESWVQNSLRIQFGRPSGPDALFMLMRLSFLSTSDSSMTNSLCETSEVGGIVESESGCRSAATCWKNLLMWPRRHCGFAEPNQSAAPMTSARVQWPALLHATSHVHCWYVNRPLSSHNTSDGVVLWVTERLVPRWVSVSQSTSLSTSNEPSTLLGDPQPVSSVSFDADTILYYRQIRYCTQKRSDRKPSMGFRLALWTSDSGWLWTVQCH